MLAYDDILNFAIELEKTIRKADNWKHTPTGGVMSSDVRRRRILLREYRGMGGRVVGQLLRNWLVEWEARVVGRMLRAYRTRA